MILARSGAGAGVRSRLLPLLTAALLAACGGGGRAGELSADVTFAPAPPRVGEAELVLALRGPDGRPLEGARVRVEGNMNHAGMVPELADAGESETEPGSYRAQLEFTMGGDWFLVVTAERGGETLEAVVDVPGVLSGGGE